MSMNAEIIAVGSELLTLARLDTNSLWLTGELNALGVEVTRKTVVGDDRDGLADAVRSALTRADLLILTGGLGPTEDDVTREAVALALDRKLIFSASRCAAIGQRFARSGRQMAEINRRQAYLLEGAEELPNPNGTAPGQWLDLGGKMLALLPGPPREMKPMFGSQCLARLKARVPEARIATRFYRVAGMGESDVDQRIAPIYKRYANPVTTILAAAGDIQIHLRAQAASAGQADALAGEVGEQILTELGERVYSTDGSTLQAIVGAALKRRGETIAVAESCTGGLLGARITTVPGASEWFLGGFLVYSKRMKMRLLGLDEALVEQHGVVSEAVATAMADSTRDRTGATWAVSITGEAGPESSTGVAPGTIWIGVAGPDKVEARVFRSAGDREWVRMHAVQTALNLLRLRLAK